VRINDGFLRYLGESDWLAASALKHGTCYGKGESKQEAKKMAYRWANHFRGLKAKAA